MTDAETETENTINRMIAISKVHVENVEMIITKSSNCKPFIKTEIFLHNMPQMIKGIERNNE